MPLSTIDLTEVENRLQRLYGPNSGEAGQAIRCTIERHLDKHSKQPRLHAEKEPPLWDQGDVVLITYADQVQPTEGIDATPLSCLRQFLLDHRLTDLINTVHLLPFFPWTSDDGFSVVDYLAVDPRNGTWQDVEDLKRQCHLMFDFVLNHISQESDWFQGYLEGVAPYKDFFIEVDPSADVSAVTRPRSLPLLHTYETSRGPKSVWTTFSRDQVDLNYGEPKVLATALDILLEYVQRGARIIRLDAIAYLWKQLGSTCIHMPQTHEVVKLMRDVLNIVAPQVLLLTETNVPHEENVSYFGDGDEAHMVYQFSLPPLLLDAILHEDATPVKQWLADLQPPQPGTTYFNFTASHDGVGVRPLEGKVDHQRLVSLVEKIRQRGGHVSMRRQPDGSESPYELNIAYVDAVAPTNSDSELRVRRFLSTQAIMLALQGVPAVYFHSLVGSPNDQKGVTDTGIPRRINRRKYQRDTLDELLEMDGTQRAIFEGIQSLLKTRIQQPAFHPNAQQTFIENDDPAVLMFERASDHDGQKILVVFNAAGSSRNVTVPDAYHDAANLIGRDSRDVSGKWNLQSAETLWLATGDN